MNNHLLPNILLRLEGLVVFCLSVILYSHFHGSWVWFAVLILFPDLGMIGYLFSKKIGSVTYNLLHFYAFPLSLIAYCFLIGKFSWLLLFALIWTAHIGIDRALGFGLKYATDFKDTHLQKV